MRKLILTLGLAVLVLAGVVGWQIASCELANFELHDDIFRSGFHLLNGCVRITGHWTKKVPFRPRKADIVQTTDVHQKTTIPTASPAE